MTSLLGLGEYVVAVVLVLALLSVAGLLLIRASRLDRRLATRHQVLIAPGVGMAAVMVGATVISRLEVGISTRVAWAVLLGICALALIVMTTARRFVPSREEPLGEGRRMIEIIRWYPFAAIVGLIPYLQLFLRDVVPRGYGTSATWTNNDLGAYLLFASNVRRNGVGDAGLLGDINLGKWVKFDHPGVHPLFAAVSGLLGREPHQMGIVYMAVALAVLVCSSIVVVETMSERALSASHVAALCAVVVNVGIVSAVANFFVAQILSVALVVTILGLAVAASRSRSLVGLAVMVALLAVACFITSPEISVSLVPIVVVVAALHGSWWRNLRGVGLGALTFGIGLGVFALVEHDLVSGQVDVLRRVSSAVAGWSANFLSLLMLGGLVPDQYSGPFTPTVRAIDALLVVGLVLWVVVRVVRRTSGVAIPAGLAMLGLLVLVGLQRWGSDGYQMWKLVVTCVPFFVVLVLALAWRDQNARPGARSLSIVVSLVVVGSTFAWSSKVWSGAGETSYLNSNLVSLARSPEAQRQDTLNIVVAPFFETMAAGSIVGTGVYMSSPTYFFGNGQPMRKGCTLTTKDRLAAIGNTGPVIATRGNYVLVGTPACE